MALIAKINQLTDKAPIFVCELPKQIVGELNVWERECKKIKNHPLGFLKAHENVGYDPNQENTYNSYQCGIPTQLVENSYWLAYIVRSCASIFGHGHRNYYLRKWDGHFDGYDIWANFAYKGNKNPPHGHAGHISGVIYHKNHKHPTIFPDCETKYDGDNGTMIIFPSNTLHCVEKQKSNKERITFAFNINIR